MTEVQKEPILPLDFKSIVMPAESADKWIAALRGGEYKQGKGYLCNVNNEYCCLGVLQHALTGDVERVDGGSLALPTYGWLQENNIAFRWSNLQEWFAHRDDEVMNVNIGLLHGSSVNASMANDIHELNFNEIADLLEVCIERV